MHFRRGILGERSPCEHEVVDSITDHAIQIIALPCLSLKQEWIRLFSILLA